MLPGQVGVPLVRELGGINEFLSPGSREMLENPGALTLCCWGGCDWGAAVNTTFKKEKGKYRRSKERENT